MTRRAGLAGADEQKMIGLSGKPGACGMLYISDFQSLAP